MARRSSVGSVRNLIGQIQADRDAKLAQAKPDDGEPAFAPTVITKPETKNQASYFNTEGA